MSMAEIAGSGRFFVYLNIDPFPTAWAAYRGQMCSASSMGTDEFRPIAYWPYGLLKRVASGSKSSLLRLEKEFALERVRREQYGYQVSRLHGIYLWESEEDAIRCEPKWRDKEGQHFEQDQLVEVEFSYTNRSRVDTQWIDHYVLNDAEPLDRCDLGWAHAYWKGERWNITPHWEILVEGRGWILGTSHRMKAFERIEDGWPHVVGQLELARLAAEIDSDLYNIAPYAFQPAPDVVRIASTIDVRDDNESFMQRVGNYIRTLDKSHVNGRALELLRPGILRTPDLRDLAFDFDATCLSSEDQACFPRVLSTRDAMPWGRQTS